MRTKMTDQEKAIIVSRYYDGISISTLTSEYGVPRSTLYSWLGNYKPLRISDRSEKTDITLKEYRDLQRRAEKQEQIISVIFASGCTVTTPLEERLSAFRKLESEYSARVLCEALSISRGTYYNRIVKNHQPTIQENRRNEMRTLIKKVFDESDQIYGADKIVAVLKTQGIHTSKKYVLKLMNEMGLCSIANQAKKNYLKLNKKKNLLRRQFTVNTPNTVWVSDVTEFCVKNYKLYTCAIVDLFSRKVVSYKISLRNSTQLVTATFKSAFAARGCPTGLMFHSDRGSPYTSTAFRKLLQSKNVVQSFSDSGKPIDNAVSESFFSLLKKEELYRRNYRSEKEFRESVAKYIKKFNSERPHGAIKNKAPDQYEREYFQQQKIKLDNMVQV